MPPAQVPLLPARECVLAVIDVQVRLLPHIHEGERVVHNTARLVEAAGVLGVPVLWAEQEKLGETAPALRAVLGGCAPFVKAEFGALGCDAFRAALEASGRTTLVLAGIESHVCVAQTALQALPDYAVHVVADATGSRRPSDREVALQRLRGAGAVVTSVEMWLYEVMGRAGTETFRAVLPLVR